MRQKLSAREFHALYCPVKNPKSAVFLVAYFAVAAFVNWKGFHKPPEHLDPLRLVFVMIVMAILAKSLVSFTCFRERLAFGVVIISFVTGEVEGFLPSIFGQRAEMVRSSHLALALVGLLVSLTMLAQSARTAKIDPNELSVPTPRQPNRNFLILFAVLAAILVLGSLLYLLPL